MKDAEDEAFDELAKRQGHWGGGYQAKKAMAMDKLQEPDEALALEALKYAASKGYGRIVRENSAPFTIKEALAQPVQEPPSEWAGIKTILDEYGLQAIDFVADFKAALAQPAQEPVAWYDKHGMITHDPFEGVTPLYTTPPQREWVGLTNDEVNNFAAGCHLGKSVQGAIYKAEAKLKELNHG